MIGTTIGKYRIVERIGRGGMGTVYRAVDETLDREVAVKIINPELVEDDLVRRFRAEAVMAARVNHPNIATVHELFREGDQLLMVMELVRGQTFEHLLEISAPFRVDRATAFASRILDALEHAHNAGIVHRDLKPANVMLTSTGTVKVMDFGIARLTGTGRLTIDGVMVGTPAYMAPEQVRGEEVDGRADLYSAGVVLYRMVTGQLPFKAPSAMAMIQSQLSDAPTPPRQVRAEVPEWLEAVLMRALAKRPADRFQTAAEFRRAIEQLPSTDSMTPTMRVTHRPATPSASATPTSVMAPPPDSGPAPAVTPVAPQSATTTVVLNRSHLAMGGVFAILLAGAVGVAVWLAMRASAPTTPANAGPAPAIGQSAPPDPTPTTIPQMVRRTATPASPADAPPAGASTTPPAPVAPPTTAAAPQPPVPSKDSSAITATERPFERGRGGRRGMEPPRPSDGNSQTVEIPNVRLYVFMPGRGARFVPTTMQFGEKAITMSEGRRGAASTSVPYEAVRHASMSRSTTPRGSGGAQISPRGIGVDFSMPRLWLTLETNTGPLLFWIEPVAVPTIANLLRQRTKVTVEHFNQ